MKQYLAYLCLVYAAASEAAVNPIKLAVETFHSNIRYQATRADSRYAPKLPATYDNSPGLGAIALYRVGEDWTFGASLGFVRYYQEQNRVMDRTRTLIFSRYSWIRRERLELYSIAGLSHQQLHADSVKSDDFHSTYTPIYNYDLGTGGAWSFGRTSLSLEYRYSDTLQRGRASVTYPYLILTSPGGFAQRAKLGFKDIAIQTQELALAANMAL